MKTRPVGIFYEHPVWFKPLFDELERRRIPFVRIHAANHQYNPAEREVPYSLLVNRVSASAHLRGNSQGVFHSAHYLAHVERLGVPVINGTFAHDIESSKARQIELLAELGMPFPKSKIVNHINQLVPAALSFRFPIVIKVNQPGRLGGLQRFASVDSLKKAISLHQVHLGVDHTAIVQEFIPARNGNIIRVETLNGKFLYALNIHTTRESYNLRPANILTTNSVEETGNPLRVEPYSPPQKIVEDVERIVRTAKIDTGAVEYVVNAIDDKVYYCNIIALSNFVDNPVQTIGFDPNVLLVDYIEDRLKPAYEFDTAPGKLD
jgi:hypothetical protein